MSGESIPPGLRGTARWTTVNASEALPGTVTPLTWGYFAPALEGGLRLSFHELGVLRGAELATPDIPDDRFLELFYGKIALNVDVFRMAADRIPGTSGDALDEQLFAAAPTGAAPATKSWAARRRYPVTAGRFPVAATRVVGRVHALRDETDALWRHTVASPPDGIPAAVAVIRTTQDLLLRNFHWHGVGTFLAQGCFDRLAQLCRACGEPGLELALLAGFTDFEEKELVLDLWALVAGTIDLPALLATHGFHGQGAAELAVPSWRVDPTPVERIVATRRAMTEPQDNPHTMQAAAAVRLRAALRGSRLLQARLILGAGRKFMPLREVGRSGILRCADTARLAAHVIGTELCAQGRLRDATDVVYLTVDELEDPAPRGWLELVEQRRLLHQRHELVVLPDRWQGAPERTTPTPVTVEGGSADELAGIAASNGIVEGRARVLDDPDDQDIEEDEILVCRSTDPSCAVLFSLAAGLVIDIGSPLSHGAILARELGLPCVINTRHATTQIRTGDRIRVDGINGIVTVLDRISAGI
jgi:phosphohistidine swiveling domain-containing protein